MSSCVRLGRVQGDFVVILEHGLREEIACHILQTVP